MTPLAQAISTALLQFIWQGIVVACALWLVLILMRNRTAATRYLVSCAALGVLLLLPVITAYSVYDSSHGSGTKGAITLTIQAVWSGPTAGMYAATPAWLATLLKLQPLVLWIWLAGVAMLSLRLAWAGGQLAILRRLAKPADSSLVTIATNLARRMGTNRVVRVLVAATSDGPSLCGWIRPAIMLPVATLLNLTPEQLEAILAHEIAHLRRYDDVVNIAQTFIETLLFYHPAVWWVSSRIRHERELCCDDLAVAICGDALCYARALTTLEKFRVAEPRLAVGANQSPLAYRIRRVIGSRTPEYVPSSLPGLLALCLAIAGVAINARPAVGAAPAPTPVEYPEAARARGIVGTVPVEVKVDATGKVTSARAMGGPEELRKAAEKKASEVVFGPLMPGPVKPGPVKQETQQVDVAFQLAQQFTNPASSTPASTIDDQNLGTLEGMVLGEGGKPLSKSTVTLYPYPQPPDNAQPTAITTTDATGKFIFEKLKPHAYTLTGEHPGYLIGSNGSKRMTQLITGFIGVDVGASQHVTGVNIELIHYSTISGKVVDEDGDPMARVMVGAGFYRWTRNGREQVNVGGVQTDDRGEFKIESLGPGRVFLSFFVPMANSPLLQERRAPGRPEERYVASYYPGTTDLNEAGWVTIPAGMDVPGINMKLKKSPVYHVRATVTGEQGPFSLFLQHGATMNGLGMVNAEGKFDAAGIAPGDYVIGVMSRDGKPLSYQPLMVADRDVDIALSLIRPETLTGKVRMLDAPPNAAAPDSLKAIQVTLTSTVSENFGQPATANAGDDGSIAIPKVGAGKYFVNVAGLPPGAYWKSLTSGGQDVTESHTLDLSNGAGAASFEIGISMAAADVTLAVSLDPSDPLPTDFVLLPDPPQPLHNWLTRRGSANPQGKFTFKSIAPGTYRVFATQTLERFVQFDPDWYKSHESRGTKIVVKENDKLQLTLPRTSSAQLADDDKRAGR